MVRRAGLAHGDGRPGGDAELDGEDLQREIDQRVGVNRAEGHRRQCRPEPPGALGRPQRAHQGPQHDGPQERSDQRSPLDQGLQGVIMRIHPHDDPVPCGVGRDDPSEPQIGRIPGGDVGEEHLEPARSTAEHRCTLRSASGCLPDEGAPAVRADHPGRLLPPVSRPEDTDPHHDQREKDEHGPSPVEATMVPPDPPTGENAEGHDDQDGQKLADLRDVGGATDEHQERSDDRGGPPAGRSGRHGQEQRGREGQFEVCGGVAVVAESRETRSAQSVIGRSEPGPTAPSADGGDNAHRRPAAGHGDQQHHPHPSLPGLVDERHPAHQNGGQRQHGVSRHVAIDRARQPADQVTLGEES